MEDNNIRKQELFIAIERLLISMSECTKAILNLKDALSKDKNPKNQQVYSNAIATCEWYLNEQNIKLKEAVNDYRDI